MIKTFRIKKISFVFSRIPQSKASGTRSDVVATGGPAEDVNNNKSKNRKM
jgi:hypothetical protein